MIKASFRVLYDSATDVLYVSRDHNVSQMAQEGDPGLLWHDNISGEDLAGVRIADFAAYWGDQFDALGNRVATPLYDARSGAAAL
jgi:hypothetical protein